MLKIIAIDHGNSCIKVAGKSAPFPSGLAEPHGFADETVEYRSAVCEQAVNDKFTSCSLQGKQYALSARRLPYMRDKWLTDDYFILTLFALARELEGLEEHIVLAVGLPPAYLRTGRAAFEAYFAGRSPIRFRYNKCPRIVHIDQVLVFPQAYAAAVRWDATEKEAFPQATLGSHRAEELNKTPRAFVVDVGGMTVDTLLLRNGKPDMAYTLSLEGGVNRLYNEISGALSSELGVRAESDQIEAALRGEDTLFDFAATHLMQAAAERFAAHLLRDLRERDIDLQTSRSVFIGGGALLLRRFIEHSPLVKAPVFVEEVNANALGYQILAEAVLHR
jgi:plasmid segregation protein ParM